MEQHKYIMLAKQLRDDILEGKYKEGEQLPSENALTQQFGFSRQTVRQAMRRLEMEGLAERLQGSGTFVIYKKEAPRASSMTVGVISTYLDDYIFPSIIRGIGKTLTKNGYSMQLAFTLNRVENEKKVLEDMLERKVDGVIAEPTKSGLPNPNGSLYKLFRSSGIPLIFFNAYYPELLFPHVALDDHAAGKTATQRLLKSGHTRIAGIFQSDDIQGHLRYAGYLEALTENGITMDSRRLLWFATEDIPNLFSDVKRAEERLKDATAVLCYNDQIAVKLLGYFEKTGARVPEDFSIASIDNSRLAEFTSPPLTSVNHPKEYLGKVVAENLLKMIDNHGFDANVDFEAKLVERDSIMDIDKELQ